MSTQTKVEFALSLWVSGDKKGFQQIIKEEEKNIFNYKGRGDIFNYFLPAVLIEGFWNDLQEIDFPLEKIVAKNFEIVGWLKWNKAVNYMNKKNPDYMQDLTKEGLYEEQMSPVIFSKNDRNLEITLDYFNTDLRVLVEEAIEKYMSMSEDDWEQIVDNVDNIINHKENKIKP